MPELVFLRRGEALLRVVLDRSRVVLGRAESSDVVIPDPSLALQQAAVLFEGGEALVEDLSGKGTVVSGRRVDQLGLPLGAEIALGQWRAELRGLASSPALRPSEERLRRWSSGGSMAGTVRVFGGSANSNGRDDSSVLGADPPMRQLTEFVGRAALSQSVVAIFGEPGTGRELVARTLHARSGRAQAPLLRVDCRAVRPSLLAELLGVDRSPPGAVNPSPRGESPPETMGGTLFLDEVGALSLGLQEALLGALESRPFQHNGMPSPSPQATRVVVATNEDLLSATRLGRFREDLYDLLCMAPLILPPLRHRRGDIPLLAAHLVSAYSPSGQRVSITAEALERLAQQPWPGNLRELRGVLQSALLRRTGSTIDVGELQLDAQPPPRDEAPAVGFVPGLTLDQMLRQREREIIESALRHFDNNRERVARELGVARSTLFKRLKDWGLTRQDCHRPPA